MAELSRRPQCLVLIAGLPGAGKTTVAKTLAEMGMPVISMGDVMREEARKRGRSEDINSMRLFMVQLRRERGEAVVARLTLEKLEGVDSPTVVIDGLRSEEELDAFKKAADRTFLILVESDLQHRFQRLSRRARPDDPKKVDDLKKRDDTELTVGLEKLMSQEGTRLVNEGDLPSLRKKVVDLVREQGITLSRVP